MQSGKTETKLAFTPTPHLIASCLFFVCSAVLERITTAVGSEDAHHRRC